MVYNMYLLLFLVLAFSYLCQNLTKDQPNVCSNRQTSKLYCCFNFENRNGSCEECDDGYTSKKGNPCERCQVGNYGYRCLEKCVCKHNMRCDNVFGCINQYDPTPSVVIFNTDEMAESEENTSAALGKYDNSSLRGPESEFFPEKTTNLYLQIMGIIIAVLVLYISIIHILCLTMYKKLKNNRNITVNQHRYDEIGTIHYDDVEVSQVSNGQSTLSRSNSITSSSEPNYSFDVDFQETESTRGIQEEAESTSSEADHLDVLELSTVEIENEYIHLYNPLDPGCHNEHPYNQYSAFLVSNETNNGETEKKLRQNIEHYVNLRV